MYASTDLNHTYLTFQEWLIRLQLHYCKQSYSSAEPRKLPQGKRVSLNSEMFVTYALELLFALV